jgi:hypothetical protein
LIELAADVSKVRVGMHVYMYSGAQVIAQGVVEDLAADKAAARVVKVATPSVNLEQNARVQFAKSQKFVV